MLICAAEKCDGVVDAMTKVEKILREKLRKSYSEAENDF